MSSGIVLRSCSSSLRSLIHRHLRRPAVVAATNSQTETPASIHNLHRLHRTVNLSAGFSIDSAGFSTSTVDQPSSSRARRNPSKEDLLERKIDESEDDSELDESVFEDFDDDDDDDDDEDEDDFDDDDDAYRSGR